MRRVLAPIGHRIAANGGAHNKKTPSLDSSLAGRDLGSWRFLAGRGLVPLEALTTNQAGFDSPALHSKCFIKITDY